MAIGGVITACLAKSRAARRQRIQNAVIELKLANFKLANRRAKNPVRVRKLSKWQPPQRERRFPWAMATMFVAMVLLTVTAFSAVVLFHKGPAAPVYTFKVAAPENTSYPGPPSVSPDGRYLTFSAVGPDGQRTLWLRPLDSEHATPMSGTEGGFSPFWSPDSRQIGFFAAGQLRKVAVTGGTPETLAPAEMRAGGGTWNPDGTIVFAPGLSDGLYRVLASGGKVDPLLKPNAARSEHSYLWPQFLPDNNHFLFFALTDSRETTGVYAGSLSPAESRFLFPSETNAVYSTLADSQSRKKGYLLFIQDRTLMGQQFDASSLELVTSPKALRDDIGALNSLSLAPISVSNNAVLVYQIVGHATRQMVWLDREGKQIAAVMDPGEWGPPRISPDGSRAVAARLEPDGKKTNLWMIDEAGAATPFTNTPAHEGSPVWSADGTRVAFFAASSPEGNFDLYTQAAQGGRPELLFRSDLAKYPSDWSHDGRYLLFTTITPGAKSDVWALGLGERHAGERRAGPILDTIHTEAYAVLSPDGQWLAYQSDETGRNEVYVQAFDGISNGTKRRWTLSDGGGGLPRWRADGKELFYVTETGRMMAVALHPNGREFEFDAPHLLFRTQPIPRYWNLYDASPDGQRFLLNLPLELSNNSSIAVVTSWTEKLKD